MVLRLSLHTFIFICLLHITHSITEQVQSDPLSSCKHYLNQYGTPYPLDICTAHSIRGFITSTKTICDYRSGSVIHQTFTGSDCLHFQSAETLDKSQLSGLVCRGSDCGVSFRTYSNDDCSSDFTDLAFIRGLPYTQQTECKVYDCAFEEDGAPSLGISTIDCETQTRYISSVYTTHVQNCRASPLHCGVSTSASSNSILLPPAISAETTAAPSSTRQTRAPTTDKLETVEQLLPDAAQDTYPDPDTTATTYDSSQRMGAAPKDGKASQIEPEYPYALPAIPIASICLTVVLLILLSLIYFLYFDQDTKRQMTSILKVFVVLSIGLHVFGIVCIMIVCLMMQTMRWSQDTYTMALLPYYGSCIGYVGGKFCLESFFLLRVYTSFQGSVFQLSTRKCVLLFVWMTCISVMWLVTFVLDEDSMYFGYIVIWAFECVFIITLLCVFGNGLQRLLAQTVKSSLHRITAPMAAKPNTHPSNSVLTCTDTGVSNAVPPVPVKEISVESSVPDLSALQSISSVNRWKYVCCKMREHVRSTKSSISSERLSLIHLMTRCVLLSSISLITTAVFGVFLSMQASIEIQSIYIMYAIWCIDITINSCCLFLNFRFTNMFYTKCCSLCHRSCQNMLEYISASHIVHNDAIKSLSDLRCVESQ